MEVLVARKIASFSPSRRLCPRFQLLRLLPSLPASPYPYLNHTLAASDAPRYDGFLLVQQLLDVFSRPVNQRPDFELQNLGRQLTPEAVEIALKKLRGWRRADELFHWALRQEGYADNCYAYNALASILSRAGQKSKLRALAMMALERRCPMTPGALGFLIRCLGDQFLVEELNYVFDNADKFSCTSNIYTYNCLLEGLAKSGRVDMVESRLSEMVSLGMELDKYSLTSVLKAYCDGGRFESALVVFDEICAKRWVDGYMFSILLVSLCKNGEVDKTWGLIERMESMNVKLNQKTFFVLTHGFLRALRIDKALAMFEKMEKYGFSGDLALYDALIRGLIEQGEVKRALGYYFEMKKTGILPDAQLVSKMIYVFCRVGDLVTAKQLFEDGERMDASSLIFLYNAVLGGLVDHGNVEGAHFLVRKMMKYEYIDTATGGGSQGASPSAVHELFRFKEAVRPNSDSFSVVVSGLCKSQKVDMALQLLQDMIPFGCTRNLLMFNDLIKALCDTDRLDESVELLRKMKDLGLKPTHFTYNSIFGCLCKREDATAAIDFMKEMRHHGHVPWIKLCTQLVKRLCEHRKVDKACKFLDDMVEVGFIPDMISYSAAIHGLCVSGNVDKALEMFRKVSSDWYLPDVVAHNIIINGFCNASRLHEAQAILEEMLEKGLVPSVVTYNIMMDAWCKEDNIDIALLCFSEMIDDDVRPATVVTFTILINGLLNASRPDEALSYWVKMKKKGCIPNKIAYTALIYGLCKCQMETVALVYFREMIEEDMAPDVSVYLALIISLIVKGNSLAAFDVLTEMLCKAKFPIPAGRNYDLLKDSISLLCKDMRTSPKVNRLIKDGRVPAICCPYMRDTNRL